MAARLPFRTHLPPTWDSVQYVLGILHYDVALHQPHPPGYYLYVHAGKLLTAVGLQPYTALVGISLLAGGLTVGLLTWWAGNLLGNQGRLAAAILALVSPLAWVYSTHGDTYAVSACSSAVVGYLCWRLLSSEAEPLWPSALALGIAGGLRPSDAMFLFPLWLWCAWRRPQIVGGLAIFAIVTIAWLVPTVGSTGGWRAYQAVTGDLRDMVWRLSPVLGNSKALAIFGVYFVASFLSVLLSAWPLALFAGLRYLPRVWHQPRSWTFLLLWAGPALLFCLTVHLGQAGYVMLLVPPAVLISTVGVVRLSESLSRWQLWIVLAMVVVLNGAFTWSVLITHDRQQEANMRQIAAALSSYQSPESVALTGIAAFGQPHEEQLLLDFRWAMYSAPQLPIYIFPLELAKRCGNPPNYGYQLDSGRVKPPVRLRGVRHLILLDPDLRRFLPSSRPSRELISNSLAHISVVDLPPDIVLSLEPNGQLQFTTESPGHTPADNPSNQKLTGTR